MLKYLFKRAVTIQEIQNFYCNNNFYLLSLAENEICLLSDFCLFKINVKK